MSISLKTDQNKDLGLLSNSQRSTYKNKPQTPIRMYIPNQKTNNPHAKRPGSDNITRNNNYYQKINIHSALKNTLGGRYSETPKESRVMSIGSPTLMYTKRHNISQTSRQMRISNTDILSGDLMNKNFPTTNRNIFKRKGVDNLKKDFINFSKVEISSMLKSGKNNSNKDFQLKMYSEKDLKKKILDKGNELNSNYSNSQLCEEFKHQRCITDQHKNNELINRNNALERNISQNILSSDIMYNSTYDAAKLRQNSTNDLSLRKTVNNNKTEDQQYENDMMAWKDKIGIKYTLCRDNALKDKWRQLDLQDSCKIEKEIQDLSSNTVQHSNRSLVYEMCGIKEDLNKLLDTITISLTDLKTHNNQQEIFQKMLCRYTQNVRNIIMRFKKTGFNYIGDTIDCLWIYLMKSIEMVVDNFDTILNKSYEEEYKQLNLKIVDLETEKNFNQNHFLSLEVKYKNEISGLNALIQSQEKTIKNLNFDNQEWAQKFEYGNDPRVKNENVDNLRTSWKNVMDHLEVCHKENQEQEVIIGKQFSKLVRMAKKENYHSVTIGTQTDLSLSFIELTAAKFDISALNYNIKSNFFISFFFQFK